jgi:hypothetical protein
MPSAYTTIFLLSFFFFLASSDFHTILGPSFSLSLSLSQSLSLSLSLSLSFYIVSISINPLTFTRLLHCLAYTLPVPTPCKNRHSPPPNLILTQTPPYTHTHRLPLYICTHRYSPRIITHTDRPYMYVHTHSALTLTNTDSPYIYVHTHRNSPPKTGCPHISAVPLQGLRSVWGASRVSRRAQAASVEELAAASVEGTGAGAGVGAGRRAAACAFASASDSLRSFVCYSPPLCLPV